MPPETGRWRVADEVAYEFMDSEAVALHLGTGTYYKLNPVAASALRHLRNGAGMTGLVDRLFEEFEVDRATLLADVRELIADLARHGLVVRVL